MKIKLVPYNPCWKIQFNQISEMLKKAIKKNTEIKHIGSTSVQDIRSKPVVDILIGVYGNDLDSYIAPIKNLGFEYIDLYEKSRFIHSSLFNRISI